MLILGTMDICQENTNFKPPFYHDEIKGSQCTLNNGSIMINIVDNWSIDQNPYNVQPIPQKCPFSFNHLFEIAKEVHSRKKMNS
jgi:hypothetical protein